MPPLEPSWERHPLHAPCEDGAVLAIPPLAEMPAMIAKNRERIATWDVQVLGKPLAELRQLAREEALAAAERFVGQASSLSAIPRQAGSLPHAPLIVSGHQPELFHSGVWAKNFVLDHLAKATGGIGLHLIVDNDAVSSTRIAVPVGSREAPRLEFIPFDADAGAAPWEEARLRDETLFRKFADRVSAALSCWPIQPMLSDLWPAAVGYASSVPRPLLFSLLTTVRREAERRLGLHNLELPISQLCETESFRWFVAALLSDPQRTHATYNEVVAVYRRVNRIRNRQHPVPDLGIRAGDSNGDWLESPLWIWRAGDSHRGRLFVRPTASELQLANGETVVASLPRIDADSAESAVAELRALSSRGWKLRPRALTNTLFARVFLADAFLHGIGGAKYDEMTDRLIARLFGVTPPSYLTVTATHRLPLGGWDVTPADVAALKHRLWDFDHNIERQLGQTTHSGPGEPEGVSPRTVCKELVRGLTPPGSPGLCSVDSVESSLAPDVRQEFAALLAEKQRLIAEQHAQDALDRHDPRRASRAENDQRRRRFPAINQRLATLAHEVRSTLAAELQAAQTHLAANTILQSREFSFCLFPWNQAALLAQP